MENKTDSARRERPKRKVKIKTDIPLKVPRKWKDEEMKTLLDCIMEHGHKDLDKLTERLPGRTEEKIKTFMRTIYDTAVKMSENHPSLDSWINHKSVKNTAEAWRDSLQIAQVLKYLSVDGLLENHPLPERCEGIDFGSAYRFIYQAVMGYPIQPINRETLDFIHETIGELNSQIKIEKTAIKNVDLFLNQTVEFCKTENIKQEITEQPVEVSQSVNKPLRVYQKKKRQTVQCEESKLPLKIVVEEKDVQKSGVGSTRDFSVRFEGSQSSVVDVPVPVADTEKLDEDEFQLLKSSSFNPFQIPEKWLKEPFYKNLL